MRGGWMDVRIRISIYIDRYMDACIDSLLF